MVRIDIHATAWSAVMIPRIRRQGSAAYCVLGLTAALMATAPPALADPVDPPPAPPAVHETATHPALGNLAPTLSGVPHLTGPQDLPLSNDDVPLGPLGPGMSYLRHLWDALQAHDANANDVLLFLTQSRMESSDPNAMSVLAPGVPTGPQQPQPGAPVWSRP
jgi:hypothetical protein